MQSSGGGMEGVQVNWTKWLPVLSSAFSLLLESFKKSDPIPPSRRDTLADAALEKLRKKDKELRRVDVVR